MHVKNSADYPGDQSMRRGFVHLDLQLAVVWLLAAAVVIGLLWSVVLSKLDNDKKVLEENATRQVISISRAYAQYLTRTVEQMDQLTQQIKYGWEKSRGMLTFEEMSNKGLLSIPQFASVSIYNREGKPVTTTIPVKRAFTVTDREYFQFHKENRANVMRIGQPVIGRLSGKKIIQITRRLEKQNGEFDGVLLIGLSPEFFSLFSDDPILGHEGILAFVGEDGVERMSKLSSEQVDIPNLLAMPVGEGNEAYDLLPGPHLFSDGKVRFTATDRVQNYPFYALVGLSQEDVLVPYERNRALYYRIGIAASGIVLLLTFGAMLMSMRLSWR
ncbi:MAG TPA: cache domain-containing protein, partial [Herminiimonas sp.]|nr:cache domain-containing protein [Herminiimonas sp.]